MVRVASSSTGLNHNRIAPIRSNWICLRAFIIACYGKSTICLPERFSRERFRQLSSQVMQHAFDHQHASAMSW